ncbi:sensor histidine kinase [Erythrobacter sp. THAF29]|uniref:sensor histidine kinase n=1 Tax=Erythrobacter sp. THAF29 TaxID=2587851 RepID=UPI0012686243|nr:histidine kinase [Erythrobacter sp. THAF29]QFT76393.1 Sensor histidine kinase YehU [Erythrobacter sp. THAF29]
MAGSASFSIPSRKSGVTVPFGRVVLSIVALWTVYFVLISARGLVLGWELQPEMLWRRTIVTSFAVLITMVLWLILRLFEGRKRWVLFVVAAVAALPGGIAIAKVNQLLFAPLEEKMEQRYAEDRGFTIRRDEAGNLLAEIVAPKEWQIKNPELFDEDNPPTVTLVLQDAKDKEMWYPLIDAGLSRYYVLLTWAAIYIALLAIAQAREAERREQQFRSAAKAAELRSLRYQVNPHFLFNTLNSLSALVITGKTDRAEKMIQTISRFYRHSLADEPTSDVPLKDEFDLQKLYLDIEAVRFPDRLTCDFDLPEDLADARVPGMILQPLVENSVKYAVSRVNRNVTITVKAREEFDRLVITVADDGPGVPEGSNHGFGIGLANVRDRLEARFGPDIGFTSAPVPGGYRTEIRIPLTRHG